MEEEKDIKRNKGWWSINEYKIRKKREKKDRNKDGQRKRYI